jgi:Spy/CpxP family protein refolding chaperone
MKKIALVLVAGMLVAGVFSISAVVADNTGKEESVQKEVVKKRNIWSELNLTADQKAKHKEILKTRKEKIDALKEATSLDPKEKRAKLQEIQQGTESEIEGMLTPAQREEYKKYKEEQVKAREEASKKKKLETSKEK